MINNLDTMKLWAISPAYLNDSDLLSEYIYLKKLLLQLTDNNQADYYHARNKIKHRLATLIAELRLRDLFNHPPYQVDNYTSLTINTTNPSQQFYLLQQHYDKQNVGRVAIPKNAQELWSHYKYAIMARNIKLYKEIGKTTANQKDDDYFQQLAELLTRELRYRPQAGGIKNALQHMWGYISDYSLLKNSDVNQLSLYQLFREIQLAVLKSKQAYLYQQVALSELEIWIL